MKKQKNATRIIAIVLVALMALALVPIAASADGPYTLFLYPNHGTEAPAQREVADGVYTLVEADEPSYEHHDFMGWAETETGTVVYETEDNVTLTENKNLYAVWQEQYCVSFDYSPGTPVSGAELTRYISQGDPVGSLPTGTNATYDGYSLMGWRKADGTQVGDMYIPTGNETLYAIWEQDFTLIINGNGGTRSGADTYTRTYPYNLGGATFYAADNDFTYTGHTYAGWSLSPDGSEITRVEFTVDGPREKTVYILWNADKVKITFNGNGADKGSIDPVTVLRNDPYYLPENGFTKTGSMFIGWTVGGASSGYMLQQPDTLMSWPADTSYNDTDKPLPVYAQWKNACTVTFHPEGGSMSPSETTRQVAEGGKLGTLPEVEREDYELVGWYKTKTPGSGDQKFTADSIIEVNTNLYAVWKSKYAVVHFAPGSTAVTGEMADDKALLGGKYTLPEVGYTYDASTLAFVGWRIGSGGVVKAAGEQIDVPADAGSINLIAQWANVITITFDAKGGVASFSTKNIAQGGEIGTLPTASKADSSFGGWFKEESYTTKVTPETTFNTAATVYAKWTTDEVHVAIDGVPESILSLYPMSRTTARPLPPYSLVKNSMTEQPPAGMAFSGWNREHGKTVAQFTDMQSVKWDGSTAALTVEDDTVTLYPVWANQLTGTVTIKKGSTDVTGGTVAVGDALTASTDATVSPLYYRWYTDGSAETSEGSSHTVTANDAEFGPVLYVDISTDPGFNNVITGHVTVAGAEKATVSFTVVGAEGTSVVMAKGQNFNASNPSGSVQVVKNAELTVDVIPSSDQAVKSVKVGDTELQISNTYTWNVTENAAVTVTFGPKGGTTPTATLNPSGFISTAAKNAFMQKASNGSYPYNVIDVVACWDGNVTNLLVLPDEMPAAGLNFTLPYPDGSNKVGANKTDISSKMTSYYSVAVWHYKGGSMSALSNFAASANYASGVAINGQKDFSPFGVVLTPTNLEGNITFSGLKEGKAAVGTPVTANFTSTKTAEGKNVPVAGKLSYQWQYKDGSDWKNISSATSETYTPTSAYKGSNLRVVVTSDFETGSVESGDFTVTEKPNPTLNKYIINDGSEQTGVIGNVTSDMQYILSSSTPGKTGWSNVSGTTIANLTEPGTYWVRFKNDDTSANWATVEMPAFYTVTAKPDSVSGNRLSFDATGDAIKYKNNVWLVTSGKSITVNAYSTDTRYYKLTKLTSQMSYSPYTTSSKSFSNANSGSITVSVKASPYVVYGSAGVYGSKTGDYSHLDLWMELACISLMGLCAAVVIGRKKLKKQ